MSLQKQDHSEGFTPNDTDLEFLRLVMQYQDGTLSEQEQQSLEQTLLQDPVKRQLFSNIQLQSAAIHGQLRQSAYGADPVMKASARRPNYHFLRWSIPIATAAVVLALNAWGWFEFKAARVAIRQHMQQPIAGRNDTSHDTPVSVPPVVEEVRLAGVSRAKFFGQLNPKEGSSLKFKEAYVLTDGLVELVFPKGARAIVEAPAVFRICNSDCLAIDSGHCSVHAPDGAEGFRVETPATRVVDRGTRFTVNVNEKIETEVQVIEGAADVYWKDEPKGSVVSQADVPVASPPLQRRLIQNDAQIFYGADAPSIVPVAFTPQSYRRDLPDRVIRYDAVRNTAGEADALISVTVQRGGRVQQYAVDELILPEVIWFKSYPGADPAGHLAGSPELPETPSAWLEDSLLNTGVINPGGSVEPLTTDPVMSTPEDPANPNTMGMAIRFHKPVVNVAGPDLVLFELQTYNNPPDGDGFHISPIRFRPGLRTKTILSYDITMVSPEALPLASFCLFQYSKQVTTLSGLLEGAGARSREHLGFRALAVGIDLSDLGYSHGETVEELFIQDVNDNTSRVDPAFIGGFPPMLKTARQE